ncbi:DUF222 domain-containing protein [Pengzhenrongella sp.]|uniref:DUF222 domain-containing protein n=1 Tax=Pengzhenrongella sp. TaxID=2888820 RepID=UPI0039C9BB94
MVLPTAGERTPTQLRGDLQKALIAVDPADAEKRTARAVDTRRVCKPKVLPDGMAGIWSVLPAFVATAIDTALSAAAHKAQRAGDTRTIDQLRADAYTATLLGNDGCTCDDARVASEPSESVSNTETGTDSDLGEGSALPGASRCAAGTGGGIGGVAGQVRVDVTVSLATLLGLDEDPAQLAGYGAVTAQTARRLTANGTWRRLVTDLQTGTVLDVGKTRYRPPEDLAEIIRARDPYCVSPICNAAARHCDLDHRVPFNPDGTGGATSTENISPACRRDHLLKTHAGWTYDRADNGTITWTTPTGHTYAYNSPPPPGHEHLPQVEPEPGLDPEPRAAAKVKPEPEQKSEADDPPPF